MQQRIYFNIEDFSVSLIYILLVCAIFNTLAPRNRGFSSVDLLIHIDKIDLNAN